MQLTLRAGLVLGLGSILLSCHADPPISPTGVPPRPTPRPAAAATATPGSTATATPTATALPTASPAATPTPDPTGALPAGPVKYVGLRILSVHDGQTNREPPYDDGAGNQVIKHGETVIFDVTPRNAANQPCETAGDPTWIVRDNPNYLELLSSSNPFLLRTRAVGRTGRTGRVHLWAEVDGVASNHLWVVVQ